MKRHKHINRIWANKILYNFSKNILQDNKWIYQEEVKCDSNDDNSPATLGLSNMRGVFILVGVGIIGGIFLICVEIIFKKHQKRLKLKDSMAKTAVRKWRGNVEVCTYFTYLFCSSISSSFWKKLSCGYVSSFWDSEWRNKDYKRIILVFEIIVQVLTSTSKIHFGSKNCQGIFFLVLWGKQFIVHTKILGFFCIFGPREKEIRLYVLKIDFTTLISRNFSVI